MFRAVLFADPGLVGEFGRHVFDEQHAVAAIVLAEDLRREHVAAPVADAAIAVQTQAQG